MIKNKLILNDVRSHIRNLHVSAQYTAETCSVYYKDKCKFIKEVGVHVSLHQLSF